MTTLSYERRTFSRSKRAYAAKGAAALRPHFRLRAAPVDPGSKVERELDLQTGAILAHMAVLLGLLVVLPQGIVATCFMEHGALLLGGSILFLSPAHS